MNESGKSDKQQDKQGGFFSRFRKQPSGQGVAQIAESNTITPVSGKETGAERSVGGIEKTASQPEAKPVAETELSMGKNTADPDDVSRFARLKQVFRRNGDEGAEREAVEGGGESFSTEEAESSAVPVAAPGDLREEPTAPHSEEQSSVADRISSENVSAFSENQEVTRQKRFGRIKQALSKTGKGFGRVFLGKKQIDNDLLETLETQLLTADLGIETTSKIIDELTDRVRRKELNDVDALQKVLKGLLVEILKPCEQPLQVDGSKPFVLLTVGVNGVGKTTTIGKLARQHLNEKQSVMLAAGDTFRAAAVEQLQVWGERNGVPVVAQHTGADSASVIYDAMESAKARQVDLLIADTAGRLHTKSNLMDELRKIKKVLGKIDPSAPQEVLLVLDAGTGQNALVQMQQFHDAVGVTGIVLTKLDGTAKGGVIFALCQKFGVPVRYIGVGEGVDDLQPFRAEDFVAALLAIDAAG